MFTSFYTGILALWLCFLFLNVVFLRRKHKVAFGHGKNMDLMKARAVHGNFIETVPFALILMILIETLYALPWLMHLLGVTLVASRIFHFVGIHASGGVGIGRVIAGVAVNLIYVVCGLMLLYAAIDSGAIFTLSVPS